MRTIAWMLTRMILIRFVAILLGISIFVITLELVSYYKEILNLDPEHRSIVFSYMLKRAPETLATFIPMSLLLAVLLSLTELSYRNEITAIWATGISPLRLTLMLLPVAFIIGGVLFVLADRAVPAAVPQLKQWGVADYRQEKIQAGEENILWMRAGDDIMRAQTANASATVLKNVLIVRRNSAGIMREQIFADEADLNGERWTLKNVAVYYRNNEPPNRLSSMVYSGAMTPAATGAHSGDPTEMSVGDLSYFISNGGFGIRPVWVYQTWMHKRFAMLLIPLVMIAMCIPLATRFHRGGGLGYLFAGGIGLGFLFFVLSGIATSMGEMGLVSPLLSAWMPVLTFGAIALALGFRMDRT